MNDMRCKLKAKWLILLPGLLLIFTSDIYSQAPLVINKLTEAIIFDGVPDEEAWQSVPSLHMLMHSPVFGNEQAEKSIIKIAYNNEYFFVSGILKYQSKDDIRAVGKKRDYATLSSDWFGLILDTFNDKKNAVSFWTNPNGLRTDFTVKNDLADQNSDINYSWNTFWDVRAVIMENYWTAEFRIPFSSLRFQTVDGLTLMGITVTQYYSSKAESYTFPAVKPELTLAYWKPSLTSVIEFSGLNPKNPVYVAPYITAGIGQVSELNNAGSSYNLTSTPKFDAGIDLKYSITNNLTVDMTVNTDFAQVEADDQKINLTRYSLYFPEKRTFFQEKADIFDFSFLGSNNLFYSRRIGIYNESPVRIYGGARMTGRINKWDVGILDMQTAPVEENPGENFGVLRTRRSVLNQNSYMGGIFTSRLGMNGTYNLAYGIDGQFRVTGDEYLTVKWAQTFENDLLNRFLDFAPSRLLLNWEHRNLKGFGYDFVYTWSGENFNPGIGFEEIDNYQGVKGMLQYGWFPEENNSIFYHKISLTAVNLWNAATSQQETAKTNLMWYFESKKGSYGYAYLNWSLEDLADSLFIGNEQASVPPGRYSFFNISSLYGTSRSHAFSSVVSINSGSFYDGWNCSLNVNPSVNIGTGISVGLDYYLDYVKFSSRSMKFTNHIAGLKGLMTLTTKTSLSAYIQYNTAINKVLTNVRFRYNPREGNDFYLVYDEGLNTNILREIPALQRSSGRTILLKYTYTFRF